MTAARLRMAVVPAAGLGTRLLPMTRALPKELLPLAGRPVIQLVMEELAACGVERAVLVTSQGKGAIEQHLAGLPGIPEVVAVQQPSPRGLGDAVLRARPFAYGEPFAVALGDCAIGRHAPARVLERLAAARAQADAVCAVAVEEVDPRDAHSYGIVATAPDGGVTDIVEKPREPPSNLAVAARYVLTPAIFDAIEHTPPGHGGELQLTDAIRLLLRSGERVVAERLRDDEPRHDVGSPAGYAAAFVELALTDPEHGTGLRELAAEILHAHRRG